MTYAEALQMAQIISKDLRADDPGFQNAVHLLTDEGCSFFWVHAFVRRLDGQWIAIFTEHHDTLVYAEDDLLKCVEYRPVAYPLSEGASDG